MKGESYRGTADSLRIETDERGFELWIETDEETFGFNVHAVAPELFEQVKRVIGSWLEEGEAVRQERRWAPFLCSPQDVDESCGQDMSALTSDYHSVHADIWDNRDKTGGRTF